MKNYVRVFCDYSADPLWNLNGSMMRLENLPVSSGLKLALKVWSFWFEWNDDVGAERRQYLGDFSSMSELKSHSDMGLKLAQEIKKELPNWTVIYFDAYLSYTKFNEKDIGIWECEIL